MIKNNKIKLCNFMIVIFFFTIIIIFINCIQQEKKGVAKINDSKELFHNGQGTSQEEYPIKIIRDYNDPNFPIVYMRLGGRNPAVIEHYYSLPLRIGLNELFESKNNPKIKIKLLKIDSEKKLCLIQYEGKTDSNIINPQWYKQYDSMFPSIFGKMGVIVYDIGKREIDITIREGSIISTQKGNDK
jgi:hypothetical protein